MRALLVLGLGALVLGGCEALIGVDDVVLHGSGGAGGAGGAPPATGTLGVGAGFAVSGSAVGASSAGTEALASSGSGGCLPDLPACPGATPTTFEGPADLAGAWSIEQPKIEVKGKKVEMDPEDFAASMRSVATLDTTSACAVWISLDGPDDDDASAGIALGPGVPGAEWIGVYRNGDTVVATSRGAAIGSKAVDVPDARIVLRVRVDGGGAFGADVKQEGGCFEPVATAVTADVGAPGVTVFQVGREGKSRFDDYCL